MNKLDLNVMDRLYARNNLDFSRALNVWKEANLSEDAIKNQFYHDTSVRLSSNDVGLIRFAIINMDSVENKDNNSLVEDDIKESVVRITPAIRQSMERVGMNTFRNKTAGTIWKIVMRDDIPHLARIDEDDLDRDTKIARK